MVMSPFVLLVTSCLLVSLSGRKLADNAGDDKVPVYSEYAFLSDFALKFEGCYTVPQFYPFGQGQNQKNNKGGLGLYPQQVVKYKLCAGEADSLRSSCKGPEYVADLNSFVNAYTDTKMTQDAYFCEIIREEAYSTGGCATAEDPITCEHTYFNRSGYSTCIQTDAESNFYVQKYLYCQQYKINNVAFYIGPLCTSDGTGVILNLFTDRYCTTLDTSGAFLAANGYSLPYSDASKNLVSHEFYSCVDQHYYSLNNMCTSLYPLSAKCEIGMTGVLANPTMSGCNYIHSVEVIQIKENSSQSAGPLTIAFACIFFLTSIGLGYYCYTLIKRMKPKLSIYVNDDGDGEFS